MVRLASALFLSGLGLGIIAVTHIAGPGWGMLAGAGVLCFMGLSAYHEARGTGGRP